CYRPNWAARGMLSPILSLSVPSDALQAWEDGLGDFAMCPASIIYDQSTPLPLQNCALSF
ncbi:Signal recognition particle 54 kDa protein, partial [Dissostichus eleginoides]